MSAWGRPAAASVVAVALTMTVGAPPGFATPRDSSFDGRPIARVDVRTRDLFDPVPGSRIEPVLRLANALHIRTRSATVRSHLLFERGDAWSTARASETARNLRALNFLRPERIEAREEGDSLIAWVETRDSWSTVIDFNLESAGGEQFGSFTFTERNIAGFGKELSVSLRDDPAGRSRSLTLNDPAVGGGRGRLRFSASTGSGGTANEFLAGVPYYAQDAPRLSLIEGLRSTSTARLYRSGSEVAQFDRREERLSASLGVGRELRGDVRRAWLTLSMRDRRLGPTRLTAAAPPDFAGREENLRVRRLSVGARWWRPRFVERTYINEMGSIEDFDLGPSVTLEAGHAPAFLGSTAGEAYLRAVADVGAVQHAAFVDARASLESRLRNSPVETLARADLRLVVHDASRTTLVLAALGVSGTDMLRDHQITLGGLNGLRAYPVNALSGRQAVRLNAEGRASSGADLWDAVRLGGAMFYDAARAWGPEAAGTGWFHAAGLGLRFSLPRLAPDQVVRIDLAWPLSPTRDGKRDAVITFGSRQAF